MPPTALVAVSENAAGASLNTNVTVPVSLATFTSVLSIDSDTVGVTGGAVSQYVPLGVDDLLHRRGSEDGVALGGGEGEAIGDDGVLTRSAGNLKGSTDIFAP